jgi:hydrogenase/urease accessory protein HupE
MPSTGLRAQCCAWRKHKTEETLMNKFRLGFFLLGSLLVVPLAQAHPGHQHDDSGLLASIVHSIVTMDYALILLAIGVGYGLWAVGRRVMQARRR